MNKIYLAGGMKSGWQEKVASWMNKQKFFSHPFIIYNPVDHGLAYPKLYTPCDLHHLRGCNIVFAYLEKSNPYGAAMASEIGYAKALGKTVVFVNESDLKGFAFVEEMSDFVVRKLEDGLSILLKLL